MSTPQPEALIKAVYYTDGSCRPNPGYGGYGLFGYTYRQAPRSKNTKHPLKAALFFTPSGVGREKSTTEIEVLDIWEAAVAVQGETSTNNTTELKAALHALQWVQSAPEIREVFIITDSRYFVNNFKDHLKSWASKGFQKQDGTVISNVHIWMALEKIRGELQADGVKILVQWVKGHSEDYGNEMADMLSVIGSNASRIQQQTQVQPFVPGVIETRIPYSAFKQSYQNKDLVYHFKDVFFSSVGKGDERHCFLSSTEDEPNTGRRTTDAIFLVNKGFVPDLVNRLRGFYRALPRNYSCTCSIKLQKLENRDMLRLAETVAVAYLLLPIPRSANGFTLIGSDGPFLQENTMEYPFIVNINKLSNAITNMQEDECTRGVAFDVGPQFLQDGKLKIDNKDRYIDLSDVVKDTISFCQRPLVGVGYDIPSYLTLKRMEENILSVQAVFNKDEESNFYTLYTKILTHDRELCSINMLNKYLAVAQVAQPIL